MDAEAGRELAAAELLMRMGEYARARERCARAVELDPGSWEAWAKKRELEELLGLEAEAKRSLAAAERILPARHLQAAELLERLGRFAEAEARLKKALRLDPGLDEARLLLAERALWAGKAKEALKRRPKGRVLGAALVLLGRFEEALAPLSSAIAEDPGDAEACSWRASALRGLGRLEEALAQAQAGLTLSDNALGANAAHALAKLEAGRPVSELEYSLIARLLPKPLAQLRAALDPKRPERAQKSLARILAAMRGNRSQEKVWLRGGKLARFEACDISDRMEGLQARLRSGDLSGVLKEFARLLREQPKEAWIHAFRGETLLWAARYAEAEKDFRRALKLAPRLRWPHVGLCGAALFSGDFEGAIAHCARAISDATPDRSWRALRGEAYRKLGRLKEARADLEVAVRVMPRRLSAWMNLALVLGELGEEAEAERLFARLRSWAPNFFGLCAAAAGSGRGAVLEQGLALMAGNRSSWLYTWLAGGRLRNIHVDFREQARSEADQGRVREKVAHGQAQPELALHLAA